MSSFGTRVTAGVVSSDEGTRAWGGPRPRLTGVLTNSAHVRRKRRAQREGRAEAHGDKTAGRQASGEAWAPPSVVAPGDHPAHTQNRERLLPVVSAALANRQSLSLANIRSSRGDKQQHGGPDAACGPLRSSPPACKDWGSRLTMGLPVMGATGRLLENKAKALASPALGTPAPEPPVLKLANLPKTHLLAPEFGKATPGPASQTHHPPSRGKEAPTPTPPAPRGCDNGATTEMFCSVYLRRFPDDLQTAATAPTSGGDALCPAPSTLPGRCTV